MSTQSKTAVVAGASGFIGRRIAERLIAERWQVTGLARKPPAEAHGMRWIAVDLSDSALTNVCDGSAQALEEIDALKKVLQGGR